MMLLYMLHHHKARNAEFEDRISQINHSGQTQTPCILAETPPLSL